MEILFECLCREREREIERDFYFLRERERDREREGARERERRNPHSKSRLSRFQREGEREKEACSWIFTSEEPRVRFRNGYTGYPRDPRDYGAPEDENVMSPLYGACETPWYARFHNSRFSMSIFPYLENWNQIKPHIQLQCKFCMEIHL